MTNNTSCALRVQNNLFKCSNTVENYKCKHCDYKTDLRFTFDEHNWKYHQNFHDYTKPKNRMLRYKCINCKFTSYSRLLNCVHEKICCESEGYKCPKCYYKCKTKAFLKCHIYRNHKGEKKRPRYSFATDFHQNESTQLFECSKCTYRTMVKNDFIFHMTSLHNSCICGYRPTRNCDLQEHYEINHPEDVHRCTKCPYTTIVQDDLNSHICSKPKSTMKKCKQCSFETFYASALKVHVFEKHVYSGTTLLFQCNRCEYRAVSMDELNSHVKSQHSTSCSTGDGSWGLFAS